MSGVPGRGCVFGGVQGDLIVSAGTADFADLVTAANGVSITGGDLTISTGDETITQGDLTLGDG